MKKAGFSTLLTVGMVFGLASIASAAGAGGEGGSPGILFASLTCLAGALSVGLAACGCGVGMGTGIGGACTGIARNPEASGKITVTMILGLALIESLTIYGLVITLILLYANPVTPMVSKMLGINL